ncbi:leukocyte elastase inhibitor-like isoform X2 [Myripristis murdjan]|uniref:leukocyte elastase inhibitor-like isoform X2 n=1 Tax=Myripristis murdjan TaxID=586833 RepID=UPI0011763DA4|nr:leukocyte elastase inhibitor-like isoform X2 [Myripristis murdjan]
MAASSPLSEANTAFCLALFKQLDEDKKSSNVFYSPLSISSALAMVMLGARANTATQMSECLKAQDDVHVKFSKLMKELNKAGAPYSLSLANRLYGDQSYQFVEGFLADTKKHYDAELESVDFKTSAETARININNWVEKQTQDKIKDLLAPGVVDSMTRLVLVNAIYFKGNWDRKFDADLTKDAQFKLNKNENKPVKMMYQKAKFPLTYIPEVNCQILELPYKGKDLSMLIFLPNEMEDDTTGLEKLEKELTYEKFVEWTQPDMMDTMEVQVGLPRFKMEESYDLKDILTRMGMGDAFDVGMSDFSGMSPANDLVLSQVVHKAFVEVNEEGTEAAAATAAIMMMRCARMPDQFIADHPFLFFIRHKPSMSVLFAGRFCSPA